MREKLTRLRDEATPPKIFRELVGEIAIFLPWIASLGLRERSRDSYRVTRAKIVQNPRLVEQ